jgi:hypothetical protein
MKEKALQVPPVERSTVLGNRVSECECPIRLKRSYERQANCYLGKPVHLATLRNFANNTGASWQTKGQLRPQGPRQ